MPHVLVVDDDSNTRSALGELVSAGGFTAALAGNLCEARIQLTRQRPDVVLIDLRLPDGNGMDLVEDLEDRESVEIVLITGHASVETAVDALRFGASDYLTKPINIQRLNAVLSRVPRTGQLKAEIGQLRDELRQLGRFGHLVGQSPPMQVLYDQIARVAPTEATVFLSGQSGTGKEIVAQTIHDLSRRRQCRFIPINCGAISPNLIESEMFGHERGSFTGAERMHKGYFEQANGGTLFLDEITEMPLDMQVSLLRVLETGAVMRVGTSAPIEVDVRIIAATNRDPRIAVEEGRMREDLFHRLNVFPLSVPPLCERGEDIVLIARHFLAELNAEHGTQKDFAPDALTRLHEYAWPGNVRELKNFVQRVYIMAGNGDLERTHVGDQGRTPKSAAPIPAIHIPVGASLAAADRQLILATLNFCNDDKRRAADMLGICLKTLYTKIKEYQLLPARTVAPAAGRNVPAVTEPGHAGFDSLNSG